MTDHARTTVVALVALASIARTQSPTVVLDGPAEPSGSTGFGRAVAALGDVDQDQTPDFAVAAPLADSGAVDGGAVEVRSGRTEAVLWRVHGDVAAERLGLALAALEDVDGDGALDLALTRDNVVAPGAPHGLVEVRSGRTGALLRAVAVGIPELSLGSAGDLDGDGAPEVFTARELGDHVVRIYSARTGSLVREHPGGLPVARLDDLDGDGTPELAVGGPSAGYGPIRIDIRSGASGTVVRSIASAQGTGVRAACGAGDVDHDGVADLYIGVESVQWQLELRSGATGEVLRSERSGNTNFDLGHRLARLGDVDGDGFADVAVGVRRYNLGDSGLRIDSGIDGRTLFHVFSPEPDLDEGSVFASAGDVDGDGRDEVLVGMYQAEVGSDVLPRVAAIGYDSKLLTLDYTTDDDFATPLENGRAVGDGARFGRVVRVTASGAGHFGPAVFDSAPTGPNGAGPAPHLLVGRGHLLVLQGRPEESSPGVFAVPSDHAGGGTLHVELLAPMRPLSLELVGLDPMASGPGATIRLVDRSGNTRTYVVDAGYTGSAAQGLGARAVDLQTRYPQPGSAGFARWSEDVTFDAGYVASIEVRLESSGAVGRLLAGVGDGGLPRARELLTLEDPAFPGNIPGEEVTFVHPAGDLDADGHGDIVVAHISRPSPNIEVRSGRDGALLLLLGGPPSWYGETLVGGHDLDGDGFPDFVIGGPLHNVPNGTGLEGLVEAVSSRTGAVLWRLTGSSLSRFGRPIVALDDVDHDGVMDFALGQTLRVRVVSGVSGATLWTRVVGPGQSPTGASGGDVDGDGVRDLVWTVPGEPWPTTMQTAVYSGTTGAVLHTQSGPIVNGALGFVAIVGDLDADGHDDLVGTRWTAPYTSETVVLSGVDLRVLHSLAGRLDALCDLDGDGTPEAIAQEFLYSTAMPNLRVVRGRSLSTRELVFSANVPFDRDLEAVWPLGDVDGDGAEDLGWYLRNYGLGFVRDHTLQVFAAVPPNGGVACHGSPSASGFGAPLRAVGSFRVADDDLTLRATAIPAGSVVLLLSAPSFAVQGAQPGLPPLGLGALCVVGGPVTRHAAASVSGHVALFPLDLGALPTLGAAGGVQAALVGETRYWQGWYRDPSAGGAALVTDALRIRFE